MPIPLDCENPDCNLACFGDFEAFAPIYQSYYSQLGILSSNFSLSSQPHPGEEVNHNTGNTVVSINWSVDLPDQARELMTIPLSDPIEPGCTVTIDFDATAYRHSGNPAATTIQVYGLTGYPCPTVNVPDCANDPFNMCAGVQGYCMTSTTCPNDPLGCPLPVDPDVIHDTNAGTVENLDLTHFTITWENLSNENITHLLFFPNTITGALPNHSRIYAIVDNVEVYSSCMSDITLDVHPDPLNLCIGGNTVSTTVTVQLTGDGSMPVTVNLQAGPLPAGLSISGGSFNSSGQAQVILTPNGPAQTLTLNLIAGPNWVSGTVIEVPITASAASGSFCFSSNQDDAVLEVIVEDCISLACACPSPGYNVTGTTTLSASSLPQNGLNSTCLAVAGTLIIDSAIPNAIYNINASTINMQPGSSIVVNPGVTLNITGGTIQGCVKLWKSIAVHGTLTVPNPADDYLTIAYSVPVEKAVMAVQLFSPVGALVTTLPLTGLQGTQQLELSAFPAGLYYLRFIANGRLISVQKIVVVH